MLLVCPVRPGDTNDELRFAMRTWETHLLVPDGLTLMTVGHRPSWMKSDIHVEGNRYKSMPLAVFDNVLLGAREAVALGEDQIIYMNDDFFCLDPTPGIVPVRRDRSLAEHVGQFSSHTSSWWTRSLRLTLDWLISEGFPDPDSYEVHRPLLASAPGMVEALSRWEWGSEDTVPQWRTVYGTIQKVDAVPVPDAKLGLRANGYGTPWISTSDETWRRYAGPIKKRFRKPSRWEN